MVQIQSRSQKWNMRTLLAFVIGLMLIGDLAEGSAAKAGLSCVAGEATDGALVVFRNGPVTLNGNGKIEGTVSLLGNNKLVLNGNAKISGAAFYNLHEKAPAVTLNGKASIPPLKAADLKTLEASLWAYANNARAMAASQSYSSLTVQKIQVIKGKGGLNVISVKDNLVLNGNSQLILEGGSEDTFLFNVGKDLVLNGNSAVDVKGIDPSRVFFNLSGKFTMNGNSDFSGTVFAPGGAVLNGSGRFAGAIFSGKEVTLNGSATIALGRGVFCPEEPVEEPEVTWEVKNKSVTAGIDSAVVQWQTPGVATSGLLHMGLTADSLNLASIEAPDFKEWQSVGLNGLQPDTLYFFQVDTFDERGKKVSGPVVSKRTLPAPQQEPEIPDPVDPQEPTEPTEPTEPVEPQDPADPVEPTEPRDPVVPVTPEEPADPTEPSEPTEPVDPVDPVDPTEPEDPQDPSEPADPEDPEEAELGIQSFDGTTTATAATIIWQTPDVQSTGTLRWGLSPGELTGSMESPNPASVHLLTIQGLQPGTRYYFQVEARSAGGAVVTSSIISKDTKQQ